MLKRPRIDLDENFGDTPNISTRPFLRLKNSFVFITVSSLGVYSISFSQEEGDTGLSAANDNIIRFRLFYEKNKKNAHLARFVYAESR